MVKAAGVPVAHGVNVSRFAAARTHVLPPPYVLKPIDEGSSVGVVIVKKGREHPPQEIARPDWPCGEMLLAETFIAGRELTCAVMGERSLGVTEIQAATGEFYDYDAKYVDPDGASLSIPAELSEEMTKRVRQTACEAYRTLELSGLSRVDFFVDKRTGALYVNEINTIPGFTSISMFPKMCEASGLPYADLVMRLLSLALDRFAERRNLQTSRP